MNRTPSTTLPSQPAPTATGSRHRWGRAVLLAIVATGLMACSSAPPVAAVVRAAAAQPLPDEIRWDGYGVPHIYGHDAATVFRGYGWAQARNHGDEVLRLYGEARGRGAEYWGAAYEPTTVWVLKNDVPARAQRWYAQQDPAFRALLDAFAQGINDYATAHPQALAADVRAVLPVSGVDVVAHAHRLMNYVYVASPPNTLAAGEGEAPVDEAAAEGEGGGEGDLGGSNTWAIAGSRTTSGHTVLLQNPHLGWDTNYFTYFEAHLVAPGFEIYGATQIGLPVVRFAFNQQMGISNTVNSMLGATWYRITPAESGDTRGYRYDGRVLPFEQRTLSYRLRGADGQLQTKTLNLRSTVHGPVFERADGTLTALRVAGLERPQMLQQYFEMVTAPSFAAYTAALQRLQVPTFNISYADRDGHIDLLFNGIAPKRSDGDNAYWRGLVPGDTPRTLWTEVHPLADLPRATDPPSGFLQNANDPPWFPTWPTVTRAEDYPPYLAPRTPESLRAQNALGALSGTAKLSIDDILQRKQSIHALMADRTLPDLLAAVAREPDAQQSPLREAAALLAGWDREFSADSRAALLFEAWARLFAGPAFSGTANFAVPFDPARATSTPSGIRDPAAAVGQLRSAIANTLKLHGRLDRPFGDASRLRVGDADLPGDGQTGGLGPVRVLGWTAPDAQGLRKANFGETWVALIEFSTPVKAWGLMSYGNARQPGSPHRADQLPLFAAHRLRPLWLLRAEVEAHTAEVTPLAPPSAR